VISKVSPRLLNAYSGESRSLELRTCALMVLRRLILGMRGMELLILGYFLVGEDATY
jgi:hypothetical protein